MITRRQLKENRNSLQESQCHCQDRQSTDVRGSNIAGTRIRARTAIGTEIGKGTRELADKHRPLLPAQAQPPSKRYKSHSTDSATTTVTTTATTNCGSGGDSNDLSGRSTSTRSTAVSLSGSVVNSKDKTQHADRHKVVRTVSASQDTKVMTDVKVHSLRYVRAPYNYAEDFPAPTAVERYHMLALGRFYKDEEVIALLGRCEKGKWTISTLKKALIALDTQDPINEYESRDIVHIRGFLDANEVNEVNRRFNYPVRKAKFQPGTDTGKASCWCKYLYIKARTDSALSPKFKEVMDKYPKDLQQRVHAQVLRSLNTYERNCFEMFFPKKEAREISVVVRLCTYLFCVSNVLLQSVLIFYLYFQQHYPCKTKGIKQIGIDKHIDDTIFRTAMLHLTGSDSSDNIWIDDHGKMRLIPLEPGDLVIFPRLAHEVKPIEREVPRRVCTFFY
jgi:hypothetical protein